MSYITDNFLLQSTMAQRLYNDFAKDAPIIDFHNHLSPKMIAENYAPKTITEMWLGGDHYKWRLMRANGVEERYITGDADDYDKFEKWAQTLPYTMRNPIYHWSQLELKRYFGEERLLTAETARSIYDCCNAKIAEGGFGAMDLLLKMNVKVVCTTDDPIDSLEYHAMANAKQNQLKVLPSWRPDRVVAIEKGDFKGYIDSLAKVSEIDITSFATLLAALKCRQQHFIANGCVVSDHGLDTFYAEPFEEAEVDAIFKAALNAAPLSQRQIAIYKSAILYHLGVMNSDANWVQQFHVGPLRNNSSQLFKSVGADVGCDSIDDKPIAEAIGRYLDSLECRGALTKTILYNLNPKDSEVMASMCYNFNSNGGVAKMQYGAAWWFLDQKDGMTKQIETISSFGLLSRFVGMLTDSRSFLSFTRHEYFRRILCNILGADIESGALPCSEYDFIGRMVRAICYDNSKKYFFGD
ncbi:MAG: glucuronate isomerase [Rikenellaceae bacterium]